MASKGSFLTNDQFLSVDDYLVSPNGQYRLAMQGDGNLCVYGPSGWIWGTQALAPGGRFFAIMQSDGNFCVYKGTGPQDNHGGVWCTMATVPGGGQFFATVENDGNFGIYKGSSPNDNQGLLWATKAVDPAIIRKFAPKIFLHPYDKSHPDSVEGYFKTVFLMNQGGIPLATTVTAATLQQYNDAGNYLEFANGQFPTASNNFETGAAIVPSGQPNVGKTNAPVYVKTFRTSTHIDIKYIFFYPFQMYQTFRVGVLSGLSTKKRNFEWSRFGRHEADWEHITVRLDPSGQRMLGVFYSQHHGSVWVEKPPMVDGTHPVALSALNSHACYWSEDTFGTGDIIKPPGLVPIGWLKAADTTTVDGLVAYDMSPRPFTVVEWVPYNNPNNPNQLVILDDNLEADRWLDFKGCWGVPRLDNTHIDRPPTLPKDVQDMMFDIAKVGKIFIPDEYKYGDGPKSPKQQDWWNNKEP